MACRLPKARTELKYVFPPAERSVQGAKFWVKCIWVPISVLALDCLPANGDKTAFR